MVKKIKRKNSMSGVWDALDLMVAGAQKVIGPDFIVSRKDDFNSENGYPDESDLEDYDQDFVDSIINLKATNAIEVPKNLASLCKLYSEKRSQFGDYQHELYESVLDNDIEAAKELGNYDAYGSKVLIRNDTEMNVFFDYVAQYRPSNGKKSLVQWNLNEPKIYNSNKKIAPAYEVSNFSLLRLDKNLDHGAIKVTNIISEKECILIDKALNRSQKEKCFYVCSTMDMNDYVMTCGAGFPLDPYSIGGKYVLTLFKKYLVNLRNKQNSEFNVDAAACARDVYGFALRSGLMRHHTVE